MGHPEKEINCLNCGSTYTKNYCPNCGQSAKVKRFNFRYLLTALGNSIDLDKGLTYSLWSLLIKPGQSIRKYILGKRVGFSNPFKLFLILGAIATILFSKSIIFDIDAAENPVPDSSLLKDWSGFVEYSGRYFSFFSLSAIPIFSFFSWVLFIRKKFNYIENIVMNVYVAAGQFLVLLVLMPLFYTGIASEVNYVYGILNFLYNVWALIYFFKAFNVLGIVKSFLAVLIPFPIVVYCNYLLYRIAPHQFWEYLDRVMN